MNDTAKKLSVVIPAYNEERTITEVLDRVHAVELGGGITKEIIVVNDGSTDTTGDRVLLWKEAYPQSTLSYIEHATNRGKGACIQTAIERATGDFLIVQDADLEYSPHDYNRLLVPILQGVADVVYGSRFVGEAPHRVLFFWHSVGNKFLTLLSNMFTDLNLTDMETCYKLFRMEVIRNLKLKEKRFGFEPEVTAKISKLPNIRIYEVGVSYYGRTYKDGKKIDWKDGIRAIYVIVRYNLFGQSSKSGHSGK